MVTGTKEEKAHACPRKNASYDDAQTEKVLNGFHLI